MLEIYANDKDLGDAVHTVIQNLVRVQKNLDDQKISPRVYD